MFANFQLLLRKSRDITCTIIERKFDFGFGSRLYGNNLKSLSISYGHSSQNFSTKHGAVAPSRKVEVGSAETKSFVNLNAASRRRYTIGHITDVEGHLDYFERCLSLSSVLTYEKKSVGRGISDLKIDFKTDDDYFVFGGDVCDHGIGDELIAESLVDFKGRYPDRVFLLAGNRDINKMQFTSVLWPIYNQDKEKGVDSLKNYLENRLGSPNAFEFRREGIAQRKGIDVTQVMDIDVAESFFNSVKPGGFMAEYLRHSQIAVIIEDSLYVHGAITEASLGEVPGGEKVQGGALEWIDSLNQFAQNEITSWLKNPYNAGKHLIDYQQPGGFDGRSIVYANWWRKGGSPFFPNQIPFSVASYLKSSNIRRVITGHAPLGDSPTVIRDSEHDITVIACDTSYSDRSAPDKRGKAISEVIVTQDYNDSKRSSKTRIRGFLSCGHAYDSTVENPQSVIGMPTRHPEGGWVKLQVGMDEFLVCSLPADPKHQYDLNQDTFYSSDLKV